MQDPVPWESELHNYDRTFARGEYRYTNRRIRGVELTELADPDWSLDTDPGFRERAGAFLRKHAHLLDRYHATAKGRKRRRLSRRILGACAPTSCSAPSYSATSSNTDRGRGSGARVDPAGNGP